MICASDNSVQCEKCMSHTKLERSVSNVMADLKLVNIPTDSINKIVCSENGPCGFGIGTGVL